MSDGMLVEETARLGRVLPSAAASALTQTLDAMPSTVNWPYRRYQVMQSCPDPWVRSLLSPWLDAWQERGSALSPQSLAFALRSTALAAAQERQSQRVELVWTGPDVSAVGLRRTEQALLQVIEVAQHSLLVVSFAVYRIPSVTEALVRAAERGVLLRICVEAPEPSGQRMSYDTVQALGQAIVQRAEVFIWPRDRRPPAPDGHVGSLHAKCAIADEHLLFISSANLTEYAMSLNIELGVLIEGGSLPGNVAAHFKRLIQDGVLQQIEHPQ